MTYNIKCSLHFSRGADCEGVCVHKRSVHVFEELLKSITIFKRACGSLKKQNRREPS